MTLAQAGAQTPAPGTDGENVFWHISWTWFGCERKGSRTGWEEEIAEQKKWDFSVQKSNIRWELPPGDLRNRGRGPESRREELRDRWVVCGHDRSEGESDTGQTGATEPVCLWWGREGPWRLAASQIPRSLSAGNGKLAISLWNEVHSKGQRFMGMGGKWDFHNDKGPFQCLANVKYGWTLWNFRTCKAQRLWVAMTGNSSVAGVLSWRSYRRLGEQMGVRSAKERSGQDGGKGQGDPSCGGSRGNDEVAE